MVTFLTLSRGADVHSARPIAVSADPVVVAEFAMRLLSAPPDNEADPVRRAVDSGRREALRMIAATPMEARS